MNSIIQFMGVEGRPRNPKLKAFHFCGSKRLLLNKWTYPVNQKYSYLKTTGIYRKHTLSHILNAISLGNCKL